MLSVGRAGTACPVERIVRGWQRVDRIAEAREARRQHVSRALHVYPDEDGMVTVRGRLTPEVGALLVQALAAARETVYRQARAPAGDAWRADVCRGNADDGPWGAPHAGKEGGGPSAPFCQATGVDFRIVMSMRDTDFVPVPAGAFTMGWANGLPSERPAHVVWVAAFMIGRTPVTNAEFAAYLEATGAEPPAFWDRPGFSDPRQPVVGVSWDEARAFAAWSRARLPTEAEWERAARGGLDGARYPWGDAPPPRAAGVLPPAGATPPNPLGLTDLSGVCHEWCADWFDEGYYGRSPARDPRGPERGDRRVSRGGAWRHADPWSPVAHRSSLPPHLRYSDYGFRLARDGG
ncbi:MAG: formylglycine-generating enzyme family protein [Candidatus Rokuibacteriota bacterium]